MDKHILIVDDDGQMLSLLRDVFEIEGWQVSLAGSIAEAKKQLELFAPDCFIIDLKLPDGDGNTLIQYLRDINQVPIIAISGVTRGVNTFNLPASGQVGADYYLSKPFEPEELIIECKRLMSHIEV